MRSFKAGFGGFDEGVWMVKCWGVKGNPRLDCLNKTGKKVGGETSVLGEER